MRGSIPRCWGCWRLGWLGSRVAVVIFSGKCFPSIDVTGEVRYKNAELSIRGLFATFSLSDVSGEVDPVVSLPDSSHIPSQSTYSSIDLLHLPPN
jgi:hypothetical protein